MLPSEYAQKLPVWVITEGINLDYLRHELKVLLEEFSRDVVFISPEEGYRYTSGGNPYPHRYVCVASDDLRCSEMLEVLDTLQVPNFELGALWTVEYYLDISPELPEARAIRLEWLKILERKLNDLQLQNFELGALWTVEYYLDISSELPETRACKLKGS